MYFTKSSCVNINSSSHSLSTVRIQTKVQNEKPYKYIVPMYYSVNFHSLCTYGFRTKKFIYLSQACDLLL